MLVYRITLPKNKDADAFATFMRKEYFPAVHKGATRIGKVTALVLLGAAATNSAQDFLLQVGWSGLSSGGPRVDDEKVQQKFDSFGAKMVPIGSYSTVAAWHARELN